MSPKKQEKLFLPTYSKELLKIAEGDFETARVIGENSSARIENAFFMAQQCIEKALKAVLVSHNIAVPLIHDLSALLAKLPDSLDPPFGYELNELTQFASIRRYETGLYDLTKEDLDEVLKKSKEMLEWAKKNSSIS